MERNILIYYWKISKIDCTSCSKLGSFHLLDSPHPTPGWGESTSSFIVTMKLSELSAPRNEVHRTATSTFLMPKGVLRLLCFEISLPLNISACRCLLSNVCFEPPWEKSVLGESQNINLSGESWDQNPDGVRKTRGTCLLEWVDMTPFHWLTLQLYGYCYQDSNDISDTLTAITELGSPLEMIQLLQTSWEDRFRVSSYSSCLWVLNAALHWQKEDLSILQYSRKLTRCKNS